MTDDDPSRAGAVLDTPRLLLRLWEEADAPAMFQAFSDPEVMRHWNTPPAASVADRTFSQRWASGPIGTASRPCRNHRAKSADLKSV